jgi:hypothetical protein
MSSSSTHTSSEKNARIDSPTNKRALESHNKNFFHNFRPVGNRAAPQAMVMLAANRRFIVGKQILIITTHYGNIPLFVAVCIRKY